MKNEETVIGDIEFWNTCIIDLKEQAKHARTLKAKVNIAKSLNSARGFLKYAEKKILALVLIGILLALSGCQTLSAAGRDITSISEALRK